MNHTCPYCGHYATTPTASEFNAELDRIYGPEKEDARYGFREKGRWVLVRRTPRILRQYGEGVICLSMKKYNEIERSALLRRTDGLA